jgi:nicotinamidase-related amidase
MAKPPSATPIAKAVHLCIDMQNIFRAGGLWPTPWMERVLPVVVSLVEHDPSRTVFTRFVTPRTAEERPGRWQHYFARWRQATQPHLVPGALDLVPPLDRFAPPATVIDKPAYSAFFRSRLPDFLAEKHVGAVIITGSETDVCVLSSVLDAVDRGFRVIVVEDGLCSSSDAGHDALMTIYRTRFTEQIELLSLDQVRALWREAG